MIYNEIKNAFERKQYISIICQSVDGMEEEIHGVPVDLSTDFMVLQEISDFYMYGYIVLPLDGILEVTVSTAASTATSGSFIPSLSSRSTAFWQMSHFCSSVGRILIAASVTKRGLL